MKPVNLLVVTLDCARHDHVLGEGAFTPTIDTLRESGVTFCRAYSQAASTIPSLYSLFTSLYPYEHGHYSNKKYKPMARNGLPVILAERGWRTGAFTGVYFLSDTMVSRDFGIKDKIEPLQRINKKLGLGPTREEPAPWSSFAAQSILKPFLYHLGLLKLTRNARKTVRRAIQWLKNLDGNGPFFRWVHLFDAHMTYSAPPKWIRYYYKGNPRRGEKNIIQQLKEKDIWFVEESYGQLFEEIFDLAYFPSLYKAAVSYMDEELGWLISHLKVNGDYDNTLVVITSDHGENLGERGIYCTHRKLFDETTLVPLIMKLPGSDYRGVEITSTVEHVDVLPTVLEYLNLPVQAQISGRSLLPLMNGQKLPSRFSISEHEGGLQFVIRWEDWQYYWTDAEVNSPYPFSFEKDLLLRNTGGREKMVLGEGKVREKLREEINSKVSCARKWYLGLEEEALDSRLRVLGYL
jgi:arylsulfatase A-like enzyme